MRPTRTRLPANAPGSLYVDTSCIDCDTCRWMAPKTYGRAAGKSYVHAQPGAAATLKAAALAAMVACPTGSIRMEAPDPLTRRVTRSFPQPVDSARLPNVLHAGYHSPASFGATPWMIAAAPSGGPNVLVDAPRYNSKLAARMEALGGVDWILLTHMDDVADHCRWAERFPAAQRVMHKLDVRDASQWPYIDMTGVERQLSGPDATWELAPGLTAIHTPGHSRGHLCFQASGKLTGGDAALFTGDHLAQNARLGRLDGFARYGWDLAQQADSIRKLAALDFLWILPGHGRRVAFASAEERRAAVEKCADDFSRDPYGERAPGPIYVQPPSESMARRSGGGGAVRSSSPSMRAEGARMGWLNDLTDAVLGPPAAAELVDGCAESYDQASSEAEAEAERAAAEGFDGETIASILMSKWGVEYDVEFTQTDYLGVASLYLNVFPWTADQTPWRHEGRHAYLEHLQAVSELLIKWGQVASVTRQLEETSLKPRRGTIPLKTVPIRLNLPNELVRSFRP